MVTRLQQIDNLEDLSDYVQTTLCNHSQLQPGAYPMTRRVLHRGGRPCAVYFCVHGPRSTKLTAIWETDRNQVLFYGSDGERFQRTQLLETFRIENAAA
ncbi:MAG: hypothetical protein ACOY3P_12440 [Planctomycetota bacterium]